MKRLLLTFFCLCVFSSLLYAEDASFKKARDYYDNFMKNEYVVSAIAKIKSEWNSFKTWFNNLPLIKDYNESIYSNKNYKKVMGEMGKEYKPHLSNDGASADMLKRGRKYWETL